MSENPSREDKATLQQTPLYGWHQAQEARMVPFAGYAMPVHYPAGVLAEHHHTRQAAGLFDVSHMGQAWLVGPDHESVARALEAVAPGDFQALPAGRQVYSVLLTPEGTILDDLMVSRPPSSGLSGKEARLMLVVNAACKEKDFAFIEAALPAGVRLDVAQEQALLALQGPKAVEILSRHCPECADMVFMDARPARFEGMACHLSRSGYTGEDGFEISAEAAVAVEMAGRLAAHPEVMPVGLGARDSLRLEAGLCLYGADMDTTVTPVEASLTWAIAKRRRVAADFPGAARILEQIAHGVGRKRVGILPDGKGPARAGTEIFTPDGTRAGVITSGGFGPTLGHPVAMGYVETAFATKGAGVLLRVRGKDRPATIAPMPFITQGYVRKKQTGE